MISRLISSLPFVLFALFVVGVPLWLAQSPKVSSQVREAEPGRVPDYLMENITAVQMGDDGAARQMLFAKRVVHYADDDSVDLEEPYFVETQPGKPAVQAKSDQAKIVNQNKDIYLKGDVVLIRNGNKSRDETTLSTSLLHLIPSDDIAKTDKPVVIRESNAVIKAVGMEMNNRTGVTKLVSQVKVLHAKSR